MENKQFRVQFGTLIKDLDVSMPQKSNMQNWKLLMTTMHCARRIGIVLVIRVLQGYPLIQIPALAILIQLQILWILSFWPMEKNLLNSLHIFNEFCLLAMVYMCLGFSGASGDATDIYSLGYSFGAVIILLILVNVSILAYDLISNCKQSRARSAAKRKALEAQLAKAKIAQVANNVDHLDLQMQ